MKFKRKVKYDPLPLIPCPSNLEKKVMDCIYEHGRLSITEISDKIGIKKNILACPIKRLKEKNLVQVVGFNYTGKEKYLGLTVEGIAAINLLKGEYKKIVALVPK